MVLCTRGRGFDPRMVHLTVFVCEMDWTEMTITLAINILGNLIFYIWLDGRRR